VIESAIYQLDGEKWDVTVPLQFWVNTETSSLQLAAGSKQHLLGFYPLGTRSSNTVKGGNDSKQDTQQSQVPWWQEYWTPTDRRKTIVKDVKAAVPTLTIQYLYNGETSEVVINDDNALSLPQT
jgi:Domain of unknown function (DUF3395)